jgi:DNA-binding response OmpR family regulator
MHALIIEPHSLISMMLEDELRLLGFTSFSTAITQDEAIAAALDQRPDLITACSRLPDGSGTEAVGIICAEKPVPTVYVVSDPRGGDEAQAGDVVVTKPINRRAFQRAVQDVMRGTFPAGDAKPMSEGRSVGMGD